MGVTWIRRVAVGALLATVAIAFADSSIVVLALPDLLGQFDVSITEVAWVVTAYNLALAVVAFALVRFAPRAGGKRLVLAGAATFLLASLACAVSPGIWELVAARTVQGAGAAALLVGALPLVGRPALWAGASVVGGALGPALGGLLTQAFDWRAIFVVQAPVAAAGLLAALFLRERPAVEGSAPSRARVAANTALGLVSAALVGLLFLAVVELVDVLRLSPLGAGLVVSAVALATLAAVPLARSGRGGTTVAGIVLLAGGLVAMAFLPSREVVWAVAALGLGGLGYGIAVPRVTRDALAGAGSTADAARTVWARHAGLVAGLLVLTPLLASDLTAAGNRAELRGIAVVLDAPVQGTDKLRLAIDIAPAIVRAPRNELPSFTAQVAHEHDPALTAMGRKLDETVQAAISRGFRRSYLVAALFALLALVPLALVRRPRALRTPAIAFALVAGLLLAELAAGAAAFGARPALVAPCGERSPPPSGMVLKGLDVVACGLHTSREQLVADAARKGMGAADLALRVERNSRTISTIFDWLRAELARR
jgi:predicted MFS family arabinose efflux permease